MGILDGLMSGKFADDPEKDAAIRHGILQFGLGLLSTPGPTSQAIGKAGILGLEGRNQFEQRQFQGKLQKNQLEEIQRKKEQIAREEAFRKGLVSPQMQASQAAMAGGGGQTVENAQKLQPIDPYQQMLREATAAGLVNPIDFMNASRKNTAPVKVGKDERLYSHDYKTELVPAAHEKPPADPADWRLYQLSGAQARGIPFEQWDLARRRAGATNVKIDNALGGGIAKEVGPLLAAGYQQAIGAQQQMQTSDSIVKAVDSNKLLSGPGATFRLKGLQIGQMLGISGRDSQETILNTRSAIQGLAQSTVASRAALKGQGQVSDFEGKLLEKAASGNIDDMTAAEIKQIALVNKRLSAQLVSQHKSFLKKTRDQKDPSISSLADFFDVEDQGQTLDWKDLPGGR